MITLVAANRFERRALRSRDGKTAPLAAYAQTMLPTIVDRGRVSGVTEDRLAVPWRHVPPVLTLALLRDCEMSIPPGTILLFRDGTRFMAFEWHAQTLAVAGVSLRTVSLAGSLLSATALSVDMAEVVLTAAVRAGYRVALHTVTLPAEVTA